MDLETYFLRSLCEVNSKGLWIEQVAQWIYGCIVQNMS